MQYTHMHSHTDSNKANNETSTDRHADRCMQTLTECTALVCSSAWPRPQIWSCRDRSVINSMRGRSRRMMMMIGRASFIGLIPRRWITIAVIQWQFLATNFRIGVPRPGPLCVAGDEILAAVIRRDLAANACRLVAHKRPRSEIVNKVTHTLTCTHARR